jgi:hypothetical protein
MRTVSLHCMRAHRLQRALRERGVRDVKLAFLPSAHHASKDALMGSACTVLEAYLGGRVSPLATAGL